MNKYFKMFITANTFIIYYYKKALPVECSVILKMRYFQGPPGDLGPVGIQGPKGPLGLMVSTTLKTLTKADMR